jgi:hypothetical protein
MFTVHGTKKFLDRVGRPGSAEAPSSTVLGDWYATVLFWRPQVALFVNEKTLLPVIVRLAPAAKVIERFPTVLTEVLSAMGVESSIIRSEVTEMSDYRLAKTQSRSILGSINEFAALGNIFREDETILDPIALSLQLANTPCGPLYRSRVSPDDEVKAALCPSNCPTIGQHSVKLNRRVER